MFESAGVLAGVFQLEDTDYRYVLANRNTADFYGLNPAAIVGRTGADLGVDPAQIALRMSTLGRCWKTRTPLTREYPFEHGGRSGWFLGTFAPVPGDIPRVSFVLVDITERKRAEMEAETERNRLAVALSATGLGLWEYDIAADRVIWDHRMRAVFGVEPDVEIDFAFYRSCLDPADAAALLEAYQRALAGDSGGRYTVEHRVMDRGQGRRWVRGSGQVIFDDAGAPLRVLGTSLDITAEVEARELQQLLIGELNHRVKNNLATVQSIALQTARTAPDLASFVDRFEGRLVSLARTHDVLTANAWSHAGLREVLERELAAQRDRATLQGPDVSLSASHGLAIGLIVHELASNAAKYGAFSGPQGRVVVVWAPDKDGYVDLEWREVGGPSVGAPSREGFGGRLMRRLAEGDLRGRMTLDFQPEGLFARLSFRPDRS